MAMCSIDPIKAAKSFSKAEVQILKIDRVADQPNLVPRFYALMLTRTKNGKVVQGITSAVSKLTTAATATTLHSYQYYFSFQNKRKLVTATEPHVALKNQGECG